MILLYKENKKLNFCEYDGNSLFVINKEGQLKEEKVSYIRRCSDIFLTKVDYKVIGFSDNKNKKHKIKDLLAIVTSYYDLYDTPVTEQLYNEIVSSSNPLEDKLYLVIDKATNAFDFFSKAQIELSRKPRTDPLQAHNVYIPDGRLLSLRSPIRIYDIHCIDLRKYIAGWTYKEFNEMVLNILKSRITGVAIKSTSKQGAMPKYKKEALDDVLKCGREQLEIVNSKYKGVVPCCEYNTKTKVFSFYPNGDFTSSNALFVKSTADIAYFTHWRKDTIQVPIKDIKLLSTLQSAIEKLMQSSFPFMSDKTVRNIRMSQHEVVTTYTDYLKAKLVKED